jgi:SNF2 family DNA or RNA helicase
VVHPYQKILKMGLWQNKRIWVEFLNDVELKDRLKKEVSGAKWDAAQLFWTFPLDMQCARDIRAIAKDMGYTIQVYKDLADWATDEKDRFANLLKPDDLTADHSKWLPRLRRDRPALIEAMASKPWQIPGAAFIVGQKRVLLADQPGLGKTIQTLAAIAELDVRGAILVVAPRTAASVTWPEEIAQWLGPDERTVIINGTVKKDQRSKLVRYAETQAKVGKRIWVICSPNYLRVRTDVDAAGNYVRDANGNKVMRVVNEGLPELFRMEWAAVIVDESHQTLAGSTGNAKKQSAQRRGLGSLKIEDGGLKIAISGTPFRGKTENIWGTLNWLAPEIFTSYWTWIRRHYGVVDNMARYGPKIVKGDRIRDEKKFYQELQPLMVRRTKAEVQKDLPPKTYGGTHLNPNDPKSPVAVWIPMSVHQAKQYNQVVREAVLTLDAMGDEINVNGVLAEMVRLKQLANASLTSSNTTAMPTLPSNKIEWIIDFIEDRIDAGTKVIVASQFTQFIFLLSRELEKKKIKHYTFTGATKDSERIRIRQEFQKDDTDMVILLNTKSGGVSLTLDQADDVVICDRTWVPDDQEQVEDRAHRVSRNHNVTIWNLASMGTIDEDIMAINNHREDVIKSILDTQRGVNYVRSLIAATKKRLDKDAA